MKSLTSIRLITCVLSIAAISVTSVADAGIKFGNRKIGKPKIGKPRIRVPQVHTPRIPMPGPYQRVVINGAYNGAKVGASAGKHLGPGGSLVGGMQGAVFGGAHAAHQHESSKVHNYRTPYSDHVFFSPQGRLTLRISGQKASGWMAYPNGTQGSLSGTVNGNYLSFNWRNNGDYGSGALQLSPDGRVLSGWYTNRFNQRSNWSLRR